MRSIGRVTLTLGVSGVVLLLAAGAYMTLRQQARPAGTERPGVLQPPAVADASEEDAVPVIDPREAPPAEVEPLALPALVPDAPSPRSKPCVLRRWDTPLPPSRERAPCTLIVVDEHDAPVAGARVELFGDAVEPRRIGIGSIEGGQYTKHVEPVGPLVSFTDASGRCVVYGPKYGPVAAVRKDGVGASGWVPLEAGNRGALQFREVLVPLRPFARLHGVVLDARGAAVPGALVEFPEPFQRSNGPALFPPPQTTDGMGRFDVTVDGGRRWIVASHGSSRAKSRQIEVASGGERELTLWLPGDWSVRGVVLASERSGGAPVPKAWVRFWPDVDAPGSDRVTGYLEKFTARADERGFFELPLQRPMRGCLSVWLAGGTLREAQRVEVSVDDPQAEVTLRLAEPAAISGRLLGADGGPCAGAEVHADAAPITSSPRVMRTGPDAGDLWGEAHAASAADGSFTLGGLHPDGVYTVSAWVGAKGVREKVVARSIRAGTTDLRLIAHGPPPVASIRLAARVRATGKPPEVLQFQCARRNDDGRWVSDASVTRTREGDVWTVSGLRPGERCALLVQADGLDDAMLENVEATTDGEPLPLLLDAPGALEVHVTHDGAPAAFAFVEATRDGGLDEWNLDRQRGLRQRCDDQGTLLGPGLQPGTWTVTASWGELTARRSVQVPPGGSARLDVDLR